MRPEYRVSPFYYSSRDNVKFKKVEEAYKYVEENHGNKKINYNKRLTIFAVTPFHGTPTGFVEETEVKMPLFGFHWQIERFDNSMSPEEAMYAFLNEGLEEELLENCKQRLVEVEKSGELRKWELVVLRDAEVIPNNPAFKKYVDRLTEEFEAPRRAQTFVCRSLAECRRKCSLADIDVFTINYKVDGENVSLPASWLDTYMFPDLFRYKGVPSGKHLSAKVWDEQDHIGYTYKVVQKDNNFMHHPYRCIYRHKEKLDYEYALKRMIDLTRY